MHTKVKSNLLTNLHEYNKPKHNLKVTKLASITPHTPIMSWNLITPKMKLQKHAMGIKPLNSQNN